MVPQEVIETPTLYLLGRRSTTELQRHNFGVPGGYCPHIHSFADWLISNSKHRNELFILYQLIVKGNNKLNLTNPNFHEHLQLEKHIIINLEPKILKHIRLV